MPLTKGSLFSYDQRLPFQVACSDIMIQKISSRMVVRDLKRRNGGPEGIRTPDLPLRRRPLYPLSYRPVRTANILSLVGFLFNPYIKKYH